MERAIVSDSKMGREMRRGEVSEWEIGWHHADRSEAAGPQWDSPSSDRTHGISVGSNTTCWKTLSFEQLDGHGKKIQGSFLCLQFHVCACAHHHWSSHESVPLLPWFESTAVFFSCELFSHYLVLGRTPDWLDWLLLLISFSQHVWNIQYIFP